MTIYTLLSCSVEGPVEGPIAGLFAREPNVRKSRLSEGAKMGDVVVRDVNSAAKAFVEMLARRDFGKRARAVGLKQDGIPAGAAGPIFSAHIGAEDSDGRYRGHDVRFAVTVSER
jgi:hypothetical protein